MTEELIAAARKMRIQRMPWKEVAIALGVNVNTLIYHVRHKSDPRYVASRSRSFEKWALNSGRKKACQ